MVTLTSLGGAWEGPEEIRDTCCSSIYSPRAGPGAGRDGVAKYQGGGIGLGLGAFFTSFGLQGGGTKERRYPTLDDKVPLKEIAASREQGCRRGGVHSSKHRKHRVPQALGAPSRAPGRLVTYIFGA